MERPINFNGDEHWPEVRYINSYVLFMAYVSMAVRGVGFLILTWTTVVLLGGFVTTLNTKDFCALTGITLLQTAGIFNVLLNEKLEYIWKSALGLTLGSTFAVVGAHENDGQLTYIARYLVGISAALFQLLLFVLVLLPLGVLYMFGLLFSTGVSLWRLIKHDYGGKKEKDNLEPALYVLYSLAVLQGVLFIYSFGFGLAEKRIVKKVAADYMFGAQTHSSILKYLRETRTGCEKDPLFAKGRNFITYAVDLMRSNILDDYLPGLLILVPIVEMPLELLLNAPNFNAQQPLMNLLIISGSSGTVLQRLLHTLDSRSPYNLPRTREYAARVVTHLARDISLEQFPLAIRSISSLLDGSGFKSLILPGLSILENLGTDKENCRIMINTDGLLSKIMGPLSSNLLHQVDHQKWSDAAEASLKVMICWLVTASEEAADRMRDEISGNQAAVNCMKGILSCQGEGGDGCHVRLRILAMKILIQVTPPIDTRGNLIQILLQIFLEKRFIARFYIENNVPYIHCENIVPNNNDNSDIRKLAGEDLRALICESRGDALIILQGGRGTVENVKAISDVLLNDECHSYRIISAGILEGICAHYNDHDQFLLDDVVPKAFRQVLMPGADADIEGGEPAVRPMNESLEVAIWSFCTAVCEKLIITPGHNLAPTFDKIVPPVNFPRSLSLLVDRNINIHTEDGVRLLKFACKMTIPMIRHRSNYDLGDLTRLETSLSNAWNNDEYLSKDLDGMMLLSAGDGVPALGYLVREVKRLLAQPINVDV